MLQYVPENLLGNLMNCTPFSIQKKKKRRVWLFLKSFRGQHKLHFHFDYIMHIKCLAHDAWDIAKSQ